MTENSEVESIYQNALGMALEKEKYSYEFYKDAEEKIKFKPLKSFFSELAEEEVKHKELILRQMEKLRRGKTPMEKKPISKPAQDLGISKYLRKQDVSEDMNYQDALILAMKREEEAVSLFEHLENLAENEEFKTFFKKLKDWEIRHLRRIEEMYDQDILTEN